MIKPYITEKSLAGAKNGLFTFTVDKSVNKLTLSAMLKKSFKVTPLHITTLTSKSVERKFRNRPGATKKLKKIIVTLKKGETLPGFEVVEDKAAAKGKKELTKGKQ